MQKSLENCKRCAYGFNPNNGNCGKKAKNCNDCTNYLGNPECKCNTVEWGTDCPFFKEESE